MLLVVSVLRLLVVLVDVVVAGIVIFLPLFLSARELCKSILGCQLQFQPLFRFPVPAS